MAKRTPWTPEQDALLVKHYPDTRTAELVDLLGHSERSIYARADILKIKKSPEFLASGKAGRLDGVRGGATRFKKGHASWNTGTHWKAGGRSPETRFKAGQMPHNTCEVGSYRFSKAGYLQRKIGNAKGSNSKRWRSVHELVWIEANGPVPPKHIVVFKPGMRSDKLEEITLDKVECISLAENMRRNTYHQYGPEIAKLVQLRGAVSRQINRRKTA